MATEFVQPARHAHDIRHRHLALVRAAQHRGDIAAYGYTVGAGTFHHWNEAFDRLVDGRIDVGAVEGLGRGGEHRDFRGADLAGTFVTLQVGHEHRIDHARRLADTAKDLGGIGELRHPLRADETGRLDRGQSRGGEPVDKLDLHRGGEHGLLVLQAVARTDFNDTYVVRCVHGYPDQAGSAKRTRIASASTKSPCAAEMDSMVPARGAFRASSIFIASMTRSSWPSSTTSPTAARTRTMRPGLGAARGRAVVPCAPAQAKAGARSKSQRLPASSCTRMRMPSMPRGRRRA